MLDFLTLLRENPYPGRGILVSRDLVYYFIMGRSANSRNRIFVKTEDGIRTEAHDPAKLEDPSLIIYHPVRAMGDALVVTNGDQTDTIRDHIQQGHCYRHALNTRAFEPDGPNFTPRISGVVKPDCTYNLSILKSNNQGIKLHVLDFSFHSILFSDIFCDCDINTIKLSDHTFLCYILKRWKFSICTEFNRIF